MRSFVKPACVIVKHANPCGVAVSTDGIGRAYDLAHQTDPTSAFGGIIAFNREVDAVTAKAIVSRQFVEVVLAPSYADDALEAFTKKANVRVLEIPLPQMPAWSRAIFSARIPAITPSAWDRGC